METSKYEISKNWLKKKDKINYFTQIQAQAYFLMRKYS